MSTSGEMCPQEPPDERLPIITDHPMFKVADSREGTLCIHEQTEFALQVRISQMEELLAVLGNCHHGPQVHRSAPQRAFGTLRVVFPPKPNSTPLGGRTD